MKCLIRCNLTKKSIEDLKYFGNQNLKYDNNLKIKTNFFIPIIYINSEYYSKIKSSIKKNISKLQTFRINIYNMKYDSNKNIYLLIKPGGFLNTIKRIIENELIYNDIQTHENITKFNCFYIDYMYTSKSNISFDYIEFPNYLKICSLDILKYNHKKITIIDSIQLN